jgi:hypothetical protein
MMNLFSRIPDDQAAETTPGVLAALLKLLRGHPLLQEAIAYDLADRAEKRAAIADQIFDARAKNKKRFAVMDREAEEARRELAAIEPTYEATVKKWSHARDRVAIAKNEATWAEEGLLTKAESLADPIIDETVASLRAMLAKHFEEGLTKGQGHHSYLESESVDAVRGIRKSTFRSNLASREARRKALLEAIETATAMKRDIEHTDIRERLAKLVESIPVVTMDVVQVEGRL